MPRPMYFASFAKKVFLRAGRIDGTVRRRAVRCARRVCGAQLVFCQRPHWCSSWRWPARASGWRTASGVNKQRTARETGSIGVSK
jgi:hypothetical protein